MRLCRISVNFGLLVPSMGLSNRLNKCGSMLHHLLSLVVHSDQNSSIYVVSSGPIMVLWYLDEFWSFDAIDGWFEPHCLLLLVEIPKHSLTISALVHQSVFRP